MVALVQPQSGGAPDQLGHRFESPGNETTYYPSMYATQDDINAGVAQCALIIIVLGIALEQNFRSRIHNRRLRNSIRVYHTLTLLTMLQGSLCIFQVFTGYDDFTIWYTNQMSYGFALASSYVVFFFKQRAIQGKHRQIFSKKAMKWVSWLETAFMIQFVGYILFVLVFPFIESVGYTEGTRRVEYKIPLFESLLTVFGDTGISTTCLVLFIIPIRDVQRVAKAASHSDTVDHTRAIIKRNRTCATAAIASTAIVLVSNMFFSGPWWVTFGCLDLTVNVALIRYMFVIPKKLAKKTHSKVTPGAVSSNKTLVDATTGPGSHING